MHVLRKYLNDVRKVCMLILTHFLISYQHFHGSRNSFFVPSEVNPFLNSSLMLVLACFLVHYKLCGWKFITISLDASHSHRSDYLNLFSFLAGV